VLDLLDVLELLDMGLLLMRLAPRSLRNGLMD
jgi:hypothetical protein